jgi:hydroxyacylglutathione hydrolase
MLLKRFYDETLAQASFLIGSTATDEAIVIDPNRDLEQYVEAAAAEHRRITHVTETHIHADFVSGARALAARTGAQLLLSGAGDADWQYRFARDDHATLLHDGDSFRVGDVRLDVMHTPGHTPEHIVFLVTDTSAADQPMGMITGDFVFAGDVGRPDLLERAANIQGSMERSARQLFDSLQRLRDYPDYLQIWPGHGAGSACGKSLGAVPMTTLGYERLFNWAFSYDTPDAFVAAVLAGQPEPPAYFATMKRINRDGPPTGGERRPVRRIGTTELGALLRQTDESRRAWVIDARPARDYGAGFIPGTLNIPFGKSFTTWAGALLPYDRDLVILTAGDDHKHARHVAHVLSLIGLDRVTAWAGAEVFEEWRTRGRPLDRIKAVDGAAIAERPDLHVIDVRGDAEWNAGHIPGAAHHFLGNLAETSAELDRDLPIAVSCQGGSRSAIAASLLRARGFKNVVNYVGGFGAWKREGRPVEADDAAPTLRGR